MAEGHDAQERTHEPTPKRRQDAQRKGQVPRSRELGTAMVLMSGSLALLFASRPVTVGITDIFSRNLGFDARALAQPDVLQRALAAALIDGLGALLPWMAVVALAAVGGSLAVGGWVLSAEQVGFQWNRLDPVQGIKRVFGARGLMETAKALGKFVLVCLAAGIALYHCEDRVLALGRAADASEAIVEAARLLLVVLTAASAATILIALVDVPFQAWQHTRQLRMSHQELKDELKDTEGRPEVKQRLRAAQQQAAQRRMLEAVPSADVVLVNPEHYAVALRYQAQRMAAPVVVARGVDAVAQRIRERARAARVPEVRSPRLARAVYHTTRLGEPIPEALYVAVAQVLAYVYQLRRGATVAAPGDLPVPDELTVPAARQRVLAERAAQRERDR